MKFSGDDLKKKLNIGCGFNKKPGYINIDKMAECKPDQQVDLEKPWPFEDSTIHEVLANHVLEHVGETTASFLFVIKELYRVCANEALVKIQVPHHNHWTFHSDPTHVRKILPETFKLFDKKENQFCIDNNYANTPLGIYCNVDFELIEATASYDEPWLSRIQNDLVTNYDLQFASKHYTNVISQWNIVLRVRK